MRNKSMQGNQNAVKETTKDSRFQTRINTDDKLLLEHYCEKKGLSMSDYLINSMVDNGILPEDRRPVKTIN